MVGTITNKWAYYNEFKPEAAHMLRQLIKDGLINDGEVDERSIVDVRSEEVRGFRQAHWFAGIGGWSVALRLAGWPDNRPVWTGSCPCQPFSSAGKQKGKADERHLWPVWFRLIRESQPSIVFGEQVSSAIRHGWWDDVADDMEGIGYATRAEVRPAISVGRPHKRNRLWFVAESQSGGGHGALLASKRQKIPSTVSAGARSLGRIVGNAQHDGRDSGQVARGHGATIRDHTQGQDSTSEFAGAGKPCDVANAERDGQANQPFDDSSGIEWLTCPDGKSRPVKSGLRLLAHGVQHRAPILHGFGNAIVPELGAQFINAIVPEVAAEFIIAAQG